MKTSLAAFVFAAVSLAASPSFAEDEPHETKTVWYGWQTLAADGATLAATYVTGNAFVMLGGYALGAPVVHWAHGNVLEGFASLGLRVAAPTLAFMVVRAAETDAVSDGHEGETAALGLVGGALFASAFDAIVLARKTITVPRLPVEPRVAVVPGGASAGVGGTF